MLIIKSNIETISIEIKSDLSVIVRAPHTMPNRDIQKFINEKSAWIDKHTKLSKQNNELPKQIPTEKFTPEEIKSLTEKAKQIIPERVDYFAKAMNVSYEKITVRHQVSRYGSCSSKGNLNFNCLLVLFPDYVLDYVVVHELCHRIEMNHSKSFWSLVERFYPEYRKSKKWLNENGNEFIKKLR